MTTPKKHDPLILEELKFTSIPIYEQLKSAIFAGNLALYKKAGQTPEIVDNDQQTNSTWFSHILIERPTSFMPIPLIKSEYADAAIEIFKHICLLNDIHSYLILRANINVLIPGQIRPTHPHVDHPFKHKNIIVYLEDADGDTVVGEQRSSPRKDKVILFEGEHYAEHPTTQPRTVIVFTYLELEENE